MIYLSLKRQAVEFGVDLVNVDVEFHKDFETSLHSQSSHVNAGGATAAEHIQPRAGHYPDHVTEASRSSQISSQPTWGSWKRRADKTRINFPPPPSLLTTHIHPHLAALRVMNLQHETLEIPRDN